MGDYEQGDGGVITWDLDSAKKAVDRMKKCYVFGCSTRIIVKNDTNLEASVTSQTHSSGKNFTIPQTIPPGAYMTFLHVHSSGCARGSVGTLGFSNDTKIEWSTPWSAFHRNSCRAKGKSTAEMVERGTTSLQYFVLKI